MDLIWFVHHYVLITDHEAQVHIQGYATSSGPIVQYVTHLFLSTELGTKW